MTDSCAPTGEGTDADGYAVREGDVAVSIDARCLWADDSFSGLMPPGGVGGVTWLYEKTSSRLAAEDELVPAADETIIAVSQKVWLDPERYTLSWFGAGLDEDGAILGEQSEDAAAYTVSVYDPSGFLVHQYTGVPWVDTETTGETWSPRRTITFDALDAGEYEVKISSTGVAEETVAIANVQLEVAEHVEPGPYEHTTVSRTILTGDCVEGDPEALRNAFDYWCDDQICFYELKSPFSIDSVAVNAGETALTGKLALGNTNFRHTSMALNVVGSGVLDCSGSWTSGCYSNSYLEYDLEHAAHYVPVIGSQGVERFDFGTGAIYRGKALAAERYISIPVGSADQPLISQPQITKMELRGRPLSGGYTLRIYDTPALVWNEVEDIQFILNYRYWSPVELSGTPDGGTAGGGSPGVTGGSSSGNSSNSGSGASGTDSGVYGGGKFGKTDGASRGLVVYQGGDAFTRDWQQTSGEPPTGPSCDPGADPQACALETYLDPAGDRAHLGWDHLSGEESWTYYLADTAGIAEIVADDVYAWEFEVETGSQHDYAEFNLVTGVASGSAGYRERLVIEPTRVRLVGVNANSGYSTYLTVPPGSDHWTTMQARNLFRLERNGNDLSFYANGDLVFEGTGGNSTISNTQLFLKASGATIDADLFVYDMRLVDDVATGSGGGAVQAMMLSCDGLPETCGPNGDENCCVSPLVPGGSFFRSSYSRDAEGNLHDTSYPATVSDFRLGRFEVTKGRFRKFIEAVIATPGGWKPADGSGKHTHLNNALGVVDPSGGSPMYEGGWDAANWDASILSTRSAWDSELDCYEHSVEVEGNDDRMPINCITWYTAYAFCIWDGGFLPTDAEWNYAAAGGGIEQRHYPWGSTPPDANENAVMSCGYDGDTETCNIADIPPVGSFPNGDGRWGHADLGGSLWEWTLDTWSDAYSGVEDCSTDDASKNCAHIAGTSALGVGGVLRGGTWAGSGGYMTANYRGKAGRTWRNDSVGFRCAREP